MWLQQTTHPLHSALMNLQLFAGQCACRNCKETGATAAQPAGKCRYLKLKDAGGHFHSLSGDRGQSRGFPGGFLWFFLTQKKGDRLIMHCWFFPSSDTRFYLLWSWKGSIFCFFVFWRANRNGWDESGRVMRQETVWVLSAWLDRMLWAGTGVEHCPQIQTRLRA